MKSVLASEFFGDYPESVLLRFKKFHSENPHVYRKFKEMSFKMKARGRGKYSHRTIFEVMRWEHDLKTTGEVFKFNSDFIPIYCRLLIYNHPEFDGFFELRRIRSKGIYSEEELKRRKNREEEEDVLQPL